MRFRLLRSTLTLTGVVAAACAPPAEPPTADEASAPAAPRPAAAVTAPATAPRNPAASDSVYPMPHGDSAQQDATMLAGPVGESRALEPEEIEYVHLGPGYIGAYTSSPYPDGTRLLWSNGVNGLYKLDYETYEIYDHLPTAQAEVYTEGLADDLIAALDADNSAAALPVAARSSEPLKDLSGVYIVVADNNWVYIAGKDGSITAYGDAVDGDPTSKIEVKGRFRMPEEAAGSTLGMNITYDGWIVLPTEQGYLVAVSKDLTQHHLALLENPDGESKERQRIGYGWVRNSLAVDPEGGVYVASRNHMHKVVWRGDGFSTDPADGAWVARYRNSTGAGTGSTPSLMGFGDEDRFVVITDGDDLMNVTLFWRDAIPEDWTTLPEAPSRRIAGQAPVTMGELDLKAVQTEQSVVVAGYGALVVNNTPRNVPSGLPETARSLFIGPLGSNPSHQPFGVEKFEWDPATRTFASAWTNTEVSSPNGVPYVSLGSEHVYFIGARDDRWTLEALHWQTGASTFHYVIGGQRYNSSFSSPVPDEKGRLFYGTTWGRARIQPSRP